MFLATLVGADPKAIVVGGRAFSCRFENDSLSPSTKAAIAEDLATVWANWPDSTVELGEENGYSGKLVNRRVWQSPYLSGKDVPDWLVRDGTNLLLYVAADISSDYEEAFVLASTKTNEMAALNRFVVALQPDAISNATPAELSVLFHGQGSITEDNRNQVVSEILGTRFDGPSVLGIGFAPKETAYVSVGTLVAGIPCHSATNPFYAVWPAAWIDGHWRLLPLY